MRRKEKEITDKTTIESIIIKADVCRLAFADLNVPYMVTMNFGYSGGENPVLYFHCAHEGRKIDMLMKNNHVCFAMDTDHEIYKGDTACDWGMKFRSIVGYGSLSIVGDNEERKRGLDLIMKHYGGIGATSYSESKLEKTTILQLDVITMSAKQSIE
jgi:nitroimidazol reductase NimA-like FMN-containing flavoprotein (pyridoxamine 5'-phosphate oxidase superfamily)